MDKFEKDGPFCELEAHGLAVGLPEGLMGNSEGKPPPVGMTSIDDNSRTFEHWRWKSCLAGSVFAIFELTLRTSYASTNPLKRENLRNKRIL